jgi:hypothetical protein
MVERRIKSRGRRYADETLWYYCELGRRLPRS